MTVTVYYHKQKYVKIYFYLKRGLSLNHFLVLKFVHGPEIVVYYKILLVIYMTSIKKVFLHL